MEPVVRNGNDSFIRTPEIFHPFPLKNWEWNLPEGDRESELCAATLLSGSSIKDMVKTTDTGQSEPQFIPSPTRSFRTEKPPRTSRTVLLAETKAFCALTEMTKKGNSVTVHWCCCPTGTLLFYRKCFCEVKAAERQTAARGERLFPSLWQHSQWSQQKTSINSPTCTHFIRALGFCCKRHTH